jgi:polyphosphate:AMP phosphotransferase
VEFQIRQKKIRQENIQMNRIKDIIDTADSIETMDKEEMKQKLEEARARLCVLQREFVDKKIPVIIVFEGMGAAGKGTQINRLIQAMDPRGFEVYTSNRATEEEERRPFLWRYWVKTPAKGRIAIFDRSWYRSVQADRFDKKKKKKQLDFNYEDINSFEKQLTDDGTVIIKLFLYIDKKEQEKRFKKLESSEETAWRVTKEDWERNKGFEEYLKINEEMIEATDTEYAPWTLIPTFQRRSAALKIIQKVCGQMEEALVEKSESAPTQEAGNIEDILGGIDLSKRLEREEYDKELDRLQKRMEKLHSELYRRGIPVVLGFEGWDAGGKGGAIKRLTSPMDPRGYRVNPTAAPNDIEKAHHYLWRFWEHMPKAGHIAIFDRTWYGRVMVERIEGFCSVADWSRAYREINEMEKHLVNFGAVVLKFWLHIDKDVQEQRFKERETTPGKEWKITDEDWRNREKWDVYKDAVNEMLVRTSTEEAPWIVVEGNDKYYARIKVLRTVIKAIEARLKN